MVSKDWHVPVKRSFFEIITNISLTHASISNLVPLEEARAVDEKYEWLFNNVSSVSVGAIHVLKYFCTYARMLLSIDFRSNSSINNEIQQRACFA